MATVSQPRPHIHNAEADLPGYGAWLNEQDRGYWLGVLRRAAEAHFATLACTCGERGQCSHCGLAEALAYTEPAEAWHNDDVVTLADEGDGIDLAELERECSLPLRKGA